MTKRRTGFLLVGLGVALLLATFVSPFASAAPDGLERVAQDHGFLAHSQTHAAPAADYTVPGVKNERVSTALAGLTGTLGVFAVACGLASLLRRKDPA